MTWMQQDLTTGTLRGPLHVIEEDIWLITPTEENMQRRGIGDIFLWATEGKSVLDETQPPDVSC